MHGLLGLHSSPFASERRGGACLPSQSTKTACMFDKWISDAVLSVLRWFIDVEWERLSLTWWSGARPTSTSLLCAAQS